MFGELPASRPGRTFRSGEWTGLFGAFALHAGLVLFGGSRAADPPRPGVMDTTVLVFPHPQRPTAAAPDPPGRASTVVLPGAPPRVDWTINPIPEVDLDGIAAAQFVPGPRQLAGAARLPTAAGRPLWAGTGPGSGTVHEDVLDIPLRPLRLPEPRYPERLRRAGIAGQVTVEFVVDTTGQVEPGSVQIIRSERPEFAEAVVRSLDRARFSPGTVRGRPVRVKVRQDFQFRLQE